MNTRTLKNVGANALDWRKFRVMAHKVWLRAADHVSAGERARAKEWCRTRSESVDDYALALAPELWEEAGAFSLDRPNPTT
jgi:hypothetical protein